MLPATPVLNIKRTLPNGAILQIVIWQLPEATRERPHRFKYRLNYSMPDGSTLVRYDNETGKGDHKHIQGQEQSYSFSTIRQLLADFNTDVLNEGGIL